MYSKPTNRTELSIPMNKRALCSHLYIYIYIHTHTHTHTNQRWFWKGKQHECS